MKKPKFDCNSGKTWGLFVHDGLGWYLHSSHWNKALCKEIATDGDIEGAEHYIVKRIAFTTQ